MREVIQAQLKGADGEIELGYRCTAQAIGNIKFLKQVFSTWLYASAAILLLLEGSAVVRHQWLQLVPVDVAALVVVGVLYSCYVKPMLEQQRATKRLWSDYVRLAEAKKKIWLEFQKAYEIKN